MGGIIEMAHGSVCSEVVPVKPGPVKEDVPGSQKSRILFFAVLLTYWVMLTKSFLCISLEKWVNIIVPFF